MARQTSKAAAPLDDITFKRFERDTPYNRDRRAEGDLRSLIYDFSVVIGGEPRAVLSRVVSGRGYELRDADGRPIPDRNGSHEHRGAEVDRQADFFQFIQDRLPRIPSATGLAELRCADAIMEIQIRHHAREEILTSRKVTNVAALHDHLSDLTRQTRQSLEKRIARSDWDKPVERTLRAAEALLASIADEPIDADALQSCEWQIRRDIRSAVL